MSVFAQRLTEWFDHRDTAHLLALAYYEREGCFPEGFLPSTVWLDPDWEKELMRRKKEVGDLPCLAAYSSIREILTKVECPGFSLRVVPHGFSFLIWAKTERGTENESPEVDRKSVV